LLIFGHRAFFVLGDLSDPRTAAIDFQTFGHRYCKMGLKLYFLGYNRQKINPKQPKVEQSMIEF